MNHYDQDNFFKNYHSCTEHPVSSYRSPKARVIVWSLENPALCKYFLFLFNYTSLSKLEITVFVSIDPHVHHSITNSKNRIVEKENNDFTYI